MHMVTHRMKVHLESCQLRCIHREEDGTTRPRPTYQMEKARNSDPGPPFNRPLPIWTYRAVPIVPPMPMSWMCLDLSRLSVWSWDAGDEDTDAALLCCESLEPSRAGSFSTSEGRTPKGFTMSIPVDVIVSCCPPYSSSPDCQNSFPRGRRSEMSSAIFTGG